MPSQQTVGFQVEVTKQTQEHSWLKILDAVRGAAALYVVCHHAVLLLMLDMTQTHHLSFMARLERGAFGIFSFGHQAVIVFFVLSGFSIHFRQAQSFYDKEGKDTNSHFATGAYFKRRLRRIAPPYYFALLLTALLCWLTRLVDTHCHPVATSNVVHDALIQHNDALTLVGNIVFLQSLRFDTFGNDSPLWSLAFEFYFYLLYPFYLKLRTMTDSRRSLNLVFAFSVFATILSLSVPTRAFWLLPIFGYWFCWVIGAFVADTYTNCTPAPKFWRSIPGAWISAALWLGVCALLRDRLDWRISDTLGAMVSAHFLHLLLIHRKPNSNSIYFKSRECLATVGIYSYSLYLMHMPILILIRSLWIWKFLQIPASPILFAIGVTVAMISGRGAYLLVECRYSNNHSDKSVAI